MGLKDYIENRARLFTMDSEFSCPDSCDRFGCKDERLHVSATIIDVVAAAFLTGQTSSNIFRSHFKIGTSPMDESPWLQRFGLELKKPCHFLAGKDCGIYGARPITCALFPEAIFLSPGQEKGLEMGKFAHYPCLQEPPSISEKRRSHIVVLMKMARRETFLTEFYFFGFSPLWIDLRNTAMDIMDDSRDISTDIGDGRRHYEVPHVAFEEILVRKLKKGGYLPKINSKVEQLNGSSGIDALYAIKERIDPTAASDKDFPYCYEFDEGNRLRLVKRPI